jgi:hypothetical protein
MKYYYIKDFVLTGGTQQVNQSMEQSLLNVQVTGTNVDDTVSYQIVF